MIIKIYNTLSLPIIYLHNSNKYKSIIKNIKIIIDMK